MWLVPLAESTAACGGKARGLARLIAAGLPVPEGWVLDDRAFRAAAGELAPHPSRAGDAAAEDRARSMTGDAPDAIGHALAAAAARLEAAELPPELVAEVDARARALGPLAVRSSAALEDGEAGAAAGVFASRVAVPPGEVWPAIRAVWASALAPLAVGYARARGAAGPAGLAIAAILQRHVDGERVTIYTRPPGAPERDEVWIQRGERTAKRGRRDGDPLVELALAAEGAIGAMHGADVELIVPAAGPVRQSGPADDRATRELAGRAWIVQARPIVHPARRAPTPPPPMVLAPLVADGRRWTWDAAHNPDPLSVAQAELVERVERAGVAPWSMRVCAGYLYAAPRDELREDAADAPRPQLASRAELDAAVRALEPRIEAALGDGGGGGDPELSLDAALERYLAFYGLWARELCPLIAAARARPPTGSLRGARPSAIEAALLAAARGELTEDAVIARFAAMAPAWDVAAPTFGEQPAALRDAIARARMIAERAPAPPPTSAVPLCDDLARAGADLAERDDLWFARAQRLVRRAILRRAAALGVPPDEAFWLPFEDLTSEAFAADPEGARRRAAAARAAAARAARWSMPFVVGGPVADASTPPAASLRGTGAGGRATGRVKKAISLASIAAAGRGDVFVTRAVTPALAVFVTGCAALVSETGGALDHGASLARELGIACVVGCRDAWSLLDDGMLVTVDGDAGTVVVEEG